MRSFLFLVLFCCSFNGHAQVSFQQAYMNHPELPQGILEAVAWTNTRMQHLQNQAASCSGYPQAYGIMGLHDDGKGYFLENGAIVAQLSGISIAQQKSNPEIQIEAYAKALSTFLPNQTGAVDPTLLYVALSELSEIPDSGLVNLLAREMQIYEVLRFMSDPQRGQQFGFSAYHFNLETTFGTNNYAILSAERITLSPTGITNELGESFTINASASLQYAPAIWNPAPACNYSSRNGVPISAITIHTIQGTYAGAISWSQNCASNVSFHYVIRSSDGQVTQMLLEEDKGWHVGSENPYTIGYEHEGYVNDPIWYTEAMYNSSADLSRDIINSGYGIPGLRTYFGASSASIDVLGGCTKIKGHQHYPNQTHTDPGINWDWEKYYRLINDSWSPTLLTSSSGLLTDSGGANGNYSDDERQFWLLQPANASSITINFNYFDLENNWDYLFIYDGDSIDAPLIGQYTGSSIPTIVSSGGSLLLEFRSDCGTTAAGWEASFTTVPSDITPPQTSISSGNSWKTDDFWVNFIDSDMESGIQDRFYLVSDKAITENAPKSDGTFGFVNESFSDGSAQWNPVAGVYTLNAGSYEINDTVEQNSNTYITVDQNNAQSYLYSWEQTMLGTAANQRAGLHFFCDDPTATNRGNSYFVYLRTNDFVQIYSVDNNIFNLEASLPFTIDPNITYDCKVTFDPNSGWIRVFIDDAFVGEWQDPTPLTSGNSISLRSGGCHVQFDNVRLYKSRGTQELIEAGLGELLGIESENAIATGFLYSIVNDASDNWSSESVEPVLLDFTEPDIIYLHDGNVSDIDTVLTPTLEANWSAQDLHSDIANYEVAIGTLPNLNNIVNWTSNGLLESFSHLLNNPIYNTVYHISVRVTNGAGLQQTFTSNGQRYIDDLSLIEKSFSNISLYPNPTSDHIQIKGLHHEVQVYIYNQQGQLLGSHRIVPETKLNVSQFESGAYHLIIRSGDSVKVMPFVVTNE